MLTQATPWFSLWEWQIGSEQHGGASVEGSVEGEAGEGGGGAAEGEVGLTRGDDVPGERLSLRQP